MKNIRNYIIRLDISYKIIFLCLIEFSYILISKNISYESNDDSAMNILSSGSYTGYPTEKLIFTQKSIGFVLRFLYESFSNFNWYPWYLILCLFIGYSNIQIAVSKQLKNNFEKIIVHLFILAIVLPILIKLQFTRVAAILIFAGCSYYYLNKKTSFLKFLVSFLLIFIGAAIRIDLLYLMILVLFPIIFSVIYSYQFKRFFIFIFIFISAFILNFIDIKSYDYDPLWKNYKELNILRSHITNIDNPEFKYDTYKDALETVGWSNYDYEMATNFNYDLGLEKFNIETLKYIESHTNSFQNSYTLRQIIDRFYYTIFVFYEFTLSQVSSLFLIFFILILVLKLNWKGFFILLGFLIYIALIITLLSLYTNINIEKQRVLWSIFLPFNVISALLVFSNKFKSDKKSNILNLKIRYYFSYIFTYVFIIFSIINLHGLPVKSNIVNGIDQFVESHSNGLYVSWCIRDPENVLNLPMNYKKAYFLGWFAGLPFNAEKIRNLTGENHEGLYSIRNREISWYFINNSYFYDNVHQNIKMQEFYKSNFPNSKLEIDTIPFKGRDSIFVYKIFVPNDSSTITY